MRQLVGLILISVGWAILSTALLWMTFLLRLNLLHGSHYTNSADGPFMSNLILTIISYDVAFLLPLPLLRALRAAALMSSLWTTAIAGMVSIAALGFWRIVGVEVSHMDCYYDCDPSVIPLNLDYTVSIVTFAVLVLSLVAYVCQKWESTRKSSAVGADSKVRW